MSKILMPSQVIAFLSIVSLLTWVTWASAQTPGSQVPLKPHSPQTTSENQSKKTFVATVFGEPLYLEALIPAESETKRKELPPQQFNEWLRSYQVTRIYDHIWGAVCLRYKEQEKVDVSDEEFAALEKSVEQNLKSRPGGPDESPFPSLEERGIAKAWSRAVLIDWKICKSLYEKYGGRVGTGSLGAWIALDGQHALLKEHHKTGDIKFHDAEMEAAFWKYAQREHFADTYPTGDRLQQLLATPPHLFAVAFAPAEQKQRERIGSALRKDIYRDELKDSPLTYHQIVQLFMAPAMEEYEREKWETFEMTDDEIRAGVEWMEAETKKQGGPRWEQWQSQSKQQKADVDKRLAAIKSQLDNPATPENERRLLKAALRVTALESTHPHAGEVWLTMHRRKFELYLYRNYGGGRIIHQQLGPEALDARRKLLLELEQAGKFQIIDPELRKLAYDYWERPSHPGGFHTDVRLLMFPWTKAHQEMIGENGGSVPAGTGPNAELSKFIQQQKARDESIRRISYQGSTRQYAGLDVQRTNTESIDQFIARVASLMPEDDQVPPYPLRGCRDFGTGVYQFTLGDINADIPKYMDWFVAGKEFVQLMGRTPGVCEAIITNKRNDIQDDREASMVRLDIAAFRPVKDQLMSEVLQNASSEPETSDAAGRPAWRLEKLNNKVGWKATFSYLQPMENPPGAKQVLWYRVYWEEIDGDLVIVRADQLSVFGDENTTPIGVMLLDDYRVVDGKPVPFRVRHFRLGKVVKGTEFTITDLKLNDSVDVPERMVIPEGSPVRNFISGKLYRQPADKTTIDR